MIRSISLILIASVAVACGPGTKSAPEPTTTTTTGTSNGKQTKDPAPVPPTSGSVPWDKSGIDWSKPPVPGPAPSFRVPTPTTFALNNKLRVVVIPRRKLPVISMRLVNTSAGSKYDGRLGGLAALTADLLDEGAGTLDTVGVSKELERLGASMSISTGEEEVTISLSTLSATLTKSLQLLRSVVSKPRFKFADFKRVRGDRLSAIRRRRDSPRRVAGLLYSKILWGNHPYGKPISGTARSLKKLRAGNVRNFYRTHYAPALMTLIVAGDVNPTSLRSQLNLTLGQWRKRIAKPRLAKMPKPVSNPPRLVVSNKANAAQSVVRIGRVSIKRKDPRHFAATVVNAALGGSFAARLMQRLREQLGYTYGARSSFWYGHKTGMWTVNTSIKTANTIDGLREAIKLIGSMSATNLPAAELARTKNLLSRGLPQRFERNSGLVSVFSNLLDHNLPLNWYDGYAAGIGGVTADQARAFATAEWNSKDLVIVVIGDLKKILPGLLKLGLGSALELDPEGKVLKTHPASDAK